MNHIAMRLAVIAFALVVFTSCRTGAIYNVVDAPVTTGNNKAPSLDEVTKAIVTAGKGLGWQMSIVQPGLIVGTLNIRSHQAVVDIPYTIKTYSIKYKNSSNLKYDAEKQTIHSNYSGWIQNLDNAIKLQLSSIGA